MNVVVAQKGSREHFLVPRALNRQGMLARLVVDWYPPGGPIGACLRRARRPGWLARAMGSAHAELPEARIEALRMLGLASRWRHAAAVRAGTTYAALLRADTAFARRLVRLSLPAHDTFFGYAYASLEMLVAERERGVRTIVDQIDPGAAEHRLVAAEEQAWPQYAHPSPPLPPAYFARSRQECDVADLVIVNSEWTRDLLQAEGVPSARMAVLPLAYEPAGATPARRPLEGGPLRVLWLGSVSLRKGIPYLIEAARRLQDAPVAFQVAGPLQVKPEALASAPPSMRWLGPVPAATAGALYAASDVFVLPTISDGFAITQLEALAHGLPVIVTPNCGRVVTDGETGFVVPPRDPQGLADALLRFVRDRTLAARMAPRCLARAREFSIDRYADSLARLIRERVHA